MNRFGLGTKRLAGNGPVDIDDAGDRERAVGLLRRAVELGINHLDTAAFYPTYATPQRGATSFEALDCANQLVRAALSPYPDGLVIATKVGPTPCARAASTRSRNTSARWPCCATRGLIRHLGLSNVRLEHLDQARAVAPVVAVQNGYDVDCGNQRPEPPRRERQRRNAAVDEGAAGHLRVGEPSTWLGTMPLPSS